ncbi:MAG: serine protease [Methylovulum sp.]|nr:serine protease [Methylovulum sp.]
MTTRKHQFSNVLIRAIFFIVLPFSSNVCAEPNLSGTIAKIKHSIVAVGSFMPKRNPRSVFLGTGFAVGDGTLVVTNAHVIPTNLDDGHLEQVAVFYRKGNEDKVITARQVALDNDYDLAVLKITGEPLPPLKLGDVASVREGQPYAFTGFPIGMVLGLYPVTHRGIVSAISPNVIPMLKSDALNPKLLRRLDAPYNVFQLDATAYPGNSGSPLYEQDTGKVIGVINKAFIQESKENILSNPSGISYAIPIDHLQKLLKDKGLY